MIQLLKEYTARTLDSDDQPMTPGMTGDFDWKLLDSSVDDIWSRTWMPSVPKTDTSIVEERQEDLQREIFPNAISDALYPVPPTIQYTFAPFVRMVGPNTYVDAYADAWVSARDVAERAIQSVFSNRFTVVLSGSESIEPDQDRFVSVRSTQLEDSELLLQRRLVDYFDRLVQEAANEVFYDGMESAFSHGLTQAVQAYGNNAVNAIGMLLSWDRTNAEAAGEILRQMGSMEDPTTHHSRLATLIERLQSPDPRIRDAASLGLASLDDPIAIDFVRKALNQESSHQLQKNLKLVLNQLQPT